MSYCVGSDFENKLEGFATAYYGTQSQNGTGTLEINTAQFNLDIISSYNRINVKLDSVDRIPVVPIGTQSDGSYNQFLIDWNVYDCIYTKLRSRHLMDFGGGDYPEWVKEIGSKSQYIEDMILNGNVTFETDVTNKGIGYPIRVVGSSIALFYSNWNTGFYEKSDYDRTYHFKIFDTSDGTTVGFAKFKVSDNDGYSYLDGTYTTGTGWIDIESGLKIRWENHPTGTLAQLAINDRWKIKCIPPNTISISSESQYKRFGRG